MKKQRIKIILMCAIIAIVFGGIVVKKQMSSNAAQPLTKEYFRLKENATTVFSKHVYVPQGMCIDGDTAYIAVLKRPVINGIQEQRVYIYKVENVTSNNPKIIEPTDYIYVGHANGLEYRDGILYVASCDKNIKGIYKVGMINEGSKIKYTVKEKYNLKINSYYGVTSKTYAKSIAYYKTVGNTPYYIVGIGQSSDKEYLKYIVGYFRDYDFYFVPINYFTVKKPLNDYRVAGEQDISCVKVNGRYKLVTSLTGSKEMTVEGSLWPEFTRNLGYVTDITYLSTKAVKRPETRIGINSRKYYKYEIEALSFAYENGRFVPYGLFNIWEKNDQKYHCTKLYKYNYNLQ